MEGKEKNKLSVYYVDGNGLFDSFNDFKTLRLIHKIVASPIGLFF